MQNLFKSSVTWSLILTAVLAALNAAQNLVSPQWTAFIVIAINVITAIAHNRQIKLGRVGFAR